MERLARKIADKLSAELGFEGEKREVIVYGMIAIATDFFYRFFCFFDRAFRRYPH